MKEIYDALNSIIDGNAFSTIKFDLQFMTNHELSCARQFAYGAFSCATLLADSKEDAEIARQLSLFYEHLLLACSDRLDRIVNAKESVHA